MNAAGNAAAAAPALARALELAGSRTADRLERIEARLLTLAAKGGPRLAVHTTGTVAAGGKRLRPLLVLLAAHGRDADEGALLRAGVAVELVHSATLVHDDVLDGARLRRGRPSVYAAAGRAGATATGDLLFSHAFAELADGDDAHAVRLLSMASSALARGELLQRLDAFDMTVDVDRYLLRCELKTASLFRAACELGALAGGADPAGLGAFGARIGLAFQILDDVLDVTGPAERIGKPRGTDLLDGTVNLPLILACRDDGELAGLSLRDLDPDRIEGVCERIEATGALERARAMALEQTDTAKALLADVPGATAEVLALVADAVVERYS